MKPRPSSPSAMEQLNDALLHAACRGTVELCEELLLAGADVDCQDSEGYTPLVVATMRNYVGRSSLLHLR